MVDGADGAAVAQVARDELESSIGSSARRLRARRCSGASAVGAMQIAYFSAARRARVHVSLRRQRLENDVSNTATIGVLGMCLGTR
ncbi:MAG: hypothetical protein ACLT98_11250 [Eggerthellaceae bacterium]